MRIYETQMNNGTSVSRAATSQGLPLAFVCRTQAGLTQEAEPKSDLGLGPKILDIRARGNSDQETIASLKTHPGYSHMQAKKPNSTMFKLPKMEGDTPMPSFGNYTQPTSALGCTADSRVTESLATAQDPQHNIFTKYWQDDDIDVVIQRKAAPGDLSNLSFD